MVQQWPTPQPQLTLSFLTRYGLLYSGGASQGAIYTWNVSTGQQLTTMTGHADACTAIADVPTQDRVASASHDRTLRIWDVTSGECETVMRGHSQGIVGLDLFEERSLLLSASYDHTARVWSPQVSSSVLVLRHHKTPLVGVRCSQETGDVLTASLDGVVSLWDLRSPVRPMQSFFVAETVGTQTQASSRPGDPSAAGSFLRSFDLCVRPEASRGSRNGDEGIGGGGRRRRSEA